MLFVVVLIATLGGMAVPQVLSSLDRSRSLAAAKYLGARLALARTLAVARGASVALRFEKDAAGIRFSVYQDGNRNGVRTADIDSGIDRQIEAPVRLYEQFPTVDIALAPGVAFADPLQIGPADLLSFSPRGTATSGTIFVSGRDGNQWAVRVLGATGRTRVLRYIAATNEWTVAF